MDLVKSVRTLWHHDVVWRYIDALSPRGFGFLLNTLVIVKFGAHAYALPAWIMAIIGVLFSLVPEPTGYILVSGKLGGRELTRLLAPWLYCKLIICVSVTVLVINFAASTLIDAVTTKEAFWDIFGALLFVSGELLWSTCAVNRFAAGTLSSWAKLGLAMRVVTLTLAVAVTWIPGAYIGQALAAFAAPIVLLCLGNLGLPRRLRRSYRVGHGALRRYSLWTYLNAFLLNSISQAPVLWAGSSPIVTPQTVGQLSYALRLLNVMIQPLTILQSVLIRDFAKDKSLGHPSYRHYRLLFRISGYAVFFVSATLAFTSYWFFHAGMEVAISLTFLGVGLGTLTFFRFEFALLNAFREVRFLYREAFLPTILAASVLYLIAYFADSLLAIALASSSAYVVLSALVFRVSRLRLATDTQAFQ